VVPVFSLLQLIEKISMTKERTWEEIQALYYVGKIREAQKACSQKERLLLRQIETALRDGDAKTFVNSMTTIEDKVTFGLRRAFQRIGRVKVPVPKHFRQVFLRMWLSNGDSLRSDVDDDLVLTRALRVLLPAYKGPARTLYRGDGFRNRKGRTYGLAWSSSRSVAEHFAVDRAKLYKEGTVLLVATVPPENIICNLGRRDNRYGENEYLVDRRGLVGVRVLRRYPFLADPSATPILSIE
jgi:hypothetical protein